MLLRPPPPLPAAGVLSLRVGLVLADVVEAVLGVRPTSLSGPRAGLKWPNDVLVDDRKVAGILCETRWQGDALQWLAVGIGVNVVNDIPAELADRAVSLCELRSNVRRIDILDHLVPALLRLTAHGAQLTEFECAAIGCGAGRFARRSRVAPRGSVLTARCSWTPARAPRWCATGTSSYLSRPMLLAFDIGNTETTVGLFANDRLEAHWRLHSAPQRTPDEWASAFTTHLVQAGHSTQEVRAAIVASVAPQVTQSLCDGIVVATTREPVRVDARSKLPIVLD